MSCFITLLKSPSPSFASGPSCTIPANTSLLNPRTITAGTIPDSLSSVSRTCRRNAMMRSVFSSVDSSVAVVEAEGEGRKVEG